MFLNTLPANGKYPVEYYENLRLQFKCNYLKNEKRFLNLLFRLWTLHQILNNLKKKKMIAIANVFPKLQTVKNFARPPCKNCVSENALTVNM